MAVDILGTTVQPVLITNTLEGTGQQGRNWCTEIVEVTFGTSNSGTTLTLNNATTAWPVATAGTGVLQMKWPVFCTADGMDATATGYTCAYSQGQVVITFAVAPTSAVIRFKIEGIA